MKIEINAGAILLKRLEDNLNNLEESITDREVRGYFDKSNEDIEILYMFGLLDKTQLLTLYRAIDDIRQNTIKRLDDEYR